MFNFSWKDFRMSRQCCRNCLKKLSKNLPPSAPSLHTFRFHHIAWRLSYLLPRAFGRKKPSETVRALESVPRFLPGKPLNFLSSFLGYLFGEILELGIFKKQRILKEMLEQRQQKKYPDCTCKMRIFSHVFRLTIS